MLYVLAACDLPLVTLNQLDTKNKVANPFKITKWDKKKCTIEVEEKPSFAIIGPELHGGYCLTKEDFALLKAKMQSDCKTANETQNLP